MSYILTLVASGNNLAAAHFDSEPTWLSPNKAAEIEVHEKPDLITLRKKFAGEKIDVFVTPAKNRRKKLLLADMDSTIVGEETLDELAGHAGIKDQVAEITARAMAGELDFHAAIRERVGLLKGLSAEMLDQTLAHTTINPGAKTFVQTMKAHGAHCVLVSGGFTFFTGAIAEAVGFHHHHGNILGIENDALTGEVIDPILDKDSKLDFLKRYAGELSITLEDTLTIGDGANDLPMLEAAGLGIGYKAKPLVIEALDNQIIHGDLSAALYAQGFSDDEINFT